MMKTQLEDTLEKNLVSQFVGVGYEFVEINNEADMLANLKVQLEKHNGLTEPLSDREFEQVKEYLNQGDIFERAKRLRDKCSVKRDDEAKETLYLSFLNMSAEGWCLNEFQVARQITNIGKYENRYDITLLINGLPLVQIELKRRGVELKTAFHQINRYQQHSYDAGIGLFQYVQIFVISNGIETKYFSNNIKQSFDYTFYWSDEKNLRVAELQPFADTFLRPCHIAKMIAQYMILNRETAEDGKENKYLAVMRPYQYYAVEAIIGKVKNGNSNGYIWHTTGSGKTLTSFKASQIIQSIEGVSKVLFVVDRNDLDYQTINTFRAYAEGSEDAVDGTKNTRALIKRLVDNDTKPIVTTIQKLNNAIIHERFSQQIEHLKDEKVVFIFDECHRSQFGETHQNICRFFTRAQMFGFTGTPIFSDNANKGTVIKKDSVQEMMKGSGANRTTKDLFGECLHKYVITDAIKDQNVLPFSVEYIGRYRENGSDTTSDIEVEAIDTDELMDSTDRLRQIVQHILRNHNARTHNRKFTAMFCVSSVPTLIRYYELFRQEQQKLKERDKTYKELRIATIFSYSANDANPDAILQVAETGNIIEEEFELDSVKMNPLSRDKLEEFMGDYNILFGTNFTTRATDSGTSGQGKQRSGNANDFYSYYKHVSKKARDAEIDILLVVNMFLTGFDSPRLNTLYVDKNLRYHGLIQAYSRTNRILNIEKSHGKIVCYRNLKARTDEAIALFADKNANEIVLLGTYAQYIDRFNKTTEELKEIMPTVSYVLPDEEEELQFVRVYREMLKLFNTIKSFADFEESDLLLSVQEIADYGSRYLTLYEQVKRHQSREKVSILKDVDFSLELMHRDDINVRYILTKMQDLKKEIPENYEIKRKEMTSLIESDVKLRTKRELIEKFIEHNLQDLSAADDVETVFREFVRQEAEKAKEKLCQEEKLIPEKLDAVVNDYQYTNIFPSSIKLKEMWKSQPSIREMKKARERLEQKTKDYLDTYQDDL